MLVVMKGKFGDETGAGAVRRLVIAIREERPVKGYCNLQRFWMSAAMVEAPSATDGIGWGASLTQACDLEVLVTEFTHSSACSMARNLPRRAGRSRGSWRMLGAALPRCCLTAISRSVA